MLLSKSNINHISYRVMDQQMEELEESHLNQLEEVERKVKMTIIAKD